MTIHEESIRSAVARETARRKRVFLSYLGLLAVPLVLGAVAVARAPAETDAVAHRMAQKVTAVVERTVSARVTEQVTSEATPLIRENVSREVSRAAGELRGSVTALGSEVERLRTTVAAVPNPEVLARMEQRVAAAATAQSVAEALEALKRQQEARVMAEKRLSDQFALFAAEFRSLRELSQSNARQLEALTGSVRKIEARLAVLERGATSRNSRPAP